MSGETSEGAIVPVSVAGPGAGRWDDEGAVLVMAVGLRGGSGGVFPNAEPEPEPTAPECVLARCRKGFVEPGVTGIGEPAVSTCLKTDVAVEGVWLWVWVCDLGLDEDGGTGGGIADDEDGKGVGAEEREARRALNASFAFALLRALRVDRGGI